LTFAPDTLEDLRDYLKTPTGLTAVSLGITGDAAHRGGYHCGKDRTTSGDYSVDESARDKAGLSLAASAIDIGGFSKGGKSLRALSLWLVEQCKAGAAGTADIREIIYSPDGKNVKRWDRLGVRSSGDSSHLWHTHISFFRDAEHRDKRAIFRAYFEGTPAPTTPAKPATPSTDWTDTLIMALPTLEKGDKGSAVRRLQGLILAYGGDAAAKLRAAGGIDGNFGDGTTAAVKLFQKAKGLVVDAIPGPKTWARLIKG